MTGAARTLLAGILLALSALVCSPGVGAAADEPVDLLLVLSADVSRSVDHAKFQLQREGYAAAIADLRVLAAITSGRNRRIAVCFVEWSGVGNQKLVIDWTLISDSASAKRFGDQIVEAPRSFADRTSISGGIDFAFAQFARAPYRSERRTIDLSGDGTHNSGRDLAAAREEALATGVTINGLVILSERPLPWNPEHTNPPGGLANYYRDNVIGGPGAFVIVAEDFKSFGQALISKLVAEIAGLPPTPHAAAHQHVRIR
ncbi:MAG: hypothetical protein BroJett024_31530 [Alphaproteobacteria bacterium]|nr:MAG: hypothetical protein BroJett024_31530 [Alphaproteobacteria bacterium]